MLVAAQSLTPTSSSSAPLGNFYTLALSFYEDVLDGDLRLNQCPQEDKEAFLRDLRWIVSRRIQALSTPLSIAIFNINRQKEEQQKNRDIVTQRPFEIQTQGLPDGWENIFRDATVKLKTWAYSNGLNSPLRPIAINTITKLCSLADAFNSVHFVRATPLAFPLTM